MAVPKRKTSKSRRDKRRSHHKIKDSNIIEDKKTGENRFGPTSENVAQTCLWILEKSEK